MKVYSGGSYLAHVQSTTNPLHGEGGVRSAPHSCCTFMSQASDKSLIKAMSPLLPSVSFNIYVEKSCLVFTGLHMSSPCVLLFSRFLPLIKVCRPCGRLAGSLGRLQSSALQRILRFPQRELREGSKPAWAGAEQSYYSGQLPCVLHLPP